MAHYREYEYGSRSERIRTGGMYCAESEKWRNVFTRCCDNESGFGLTGREMEILRLIQRGFLSKEIADKLCISIHTVHIHRQICCVSWEYKTLWRQYA